MSKKKLLLFIRSKVGPVIVTSSAGENQDLTLYLNNQLRYYYDFKTGVASNERTYKFSGNYICPVYRWLFNYNINIYGLQHGWQRAYGNEVITTLK